MSHERNPFYNRDTTTTTDETPVHLRTFRQRTTMSASSDTPPSTPGSDVIPPEDPILRSPQAWHPSQRPRQLFQNPRRSRSRLLVFTLVGVSFIVVAITLLALKDRIHVANLRRAGIPPGLYSKDGVLYAGTDPFAIKGFSWYGMEEDAKVPGGMKEMSVAEVFGFMKRNKFNAVRIPLAVDNILENGFPTGRINTFKNPMLLDMNYLSILRTVIKRAAQSNILVLLDAHRLQNHETPDDSNGLWHSPEVPEQKLFDAWRVLCRKFGDYWNVMGADIFNEPFNATWGSSGPLDDWKGASERLSEHVHEACPSWLVMIQGVGEKEKTKDPPFWAENLKPMYDKPPEVTLSQKVALSPHVYGPDTYEQPYFKGKHFTDNMPPIWDDHFGKASEMTGFATVVGEWGGRNKGRDGEWQRRFLQYLQEKKMGSFYWCLNPESKDTGGLMQEGWFYEENEKLDQLDSLPSSRVEDYRIHFEYWRDWRTQ